MAEIYRLGWFSTGRDKAARDLLETVYGNIVAGYIEAKIAFVFCNREPEESYKTNLFMKQVDRYHIPLVAYSYQKFKASRSVSKTKEGELPDWRLEYDREVMKRLKGFKVDLCVLAGYMLIVGKEMCRKYDMLNLHPAAPGGPTGTWQEVIWKLIETEAQETGVMMHLVTPELDKGPPVTYCTFSIRGKPFDRYWERVKGRSVEEIKQTEGENNKLFKLIRGYGVARELPLIVATIKAFADGKVRITPDKRVVDAEGKPIKGYNLTGEIERLLKQRG